MRLAAWLTVVGVVLVAVGVGLYDFRAGLVLLGVASAGVGLWNLTQE